jgi:hypothetical protein
MRPPILVGLLVAGLLGGLYLAKSKPSEAELDRTYALAMSPTMQNVGELQWASALLRTHGRAPQADMVDLKIGALKQRTVVTAPPQVGFQTGHHYTGRVQLSGLEAVFAGVSDVQNGATTAIGMPVTVESLGSGAYLVSGTWTGPAAPYPTPLPDRVQWIRDDTTGEVIQ